MQTFKRNCPRCDEEILPKTEECPRCMMKISVGTGSEFFDEPIQNW